MKPILHFKFEEYKHSREEMSTYANFLYEKFNNEYNIILTPFEISNPTKDSIIFNFNGVDYTYEEIIKVIEKGLLNGVDYGFYEVEKLNKDE